MSKLERDLGALSLLGVLVLVVVVGLVFSSSFLAKALFISA
jgi:hypothetical protein